MKSFALAFLCLIASFSAWSQTPQSFNYQAIARDASGTVIANQDVSFKISIHQQSHDGQITYSEIHQVTTNAFGLANLAIGNGEPVSGTFSSIDWGSNRHFLEIGFDPKGRSDFKSMGSSQLLSVPYAMHAATVEFDNVEDADADPSNEIQFLRMSGDTLYLSQGNFVVMNNTTAANRKFNQELVLEGNKLSISLHKAENEV